MINNINNYVDNCITGFKAMPEATRVETIIKVGCVTIGAGLITSLASPVLIVPMSFTAGAAFFGKQTNDYSKINGMVDHVKQFIGFDRVNQAAKQVNQGSYLKAVKIFWS